MQRIRNPKRANDTPNRGKSCLRRHRCGRPPTRPRPYPAGMAPTLGEALALPVLQAGRPRVLAGADRLDVQVRWAHVAEVLEIPALLRGGELVLSTGIGLPRDDAGLAAFVRALAGVPVAALVVELGRAWSERLPAAMVQAARTAG